MELDVVIERHEQRLNTLERDMGAMKDVQNEIRTMNESLVTLANEMRHTCNTVFHSVEKCTSKLAFKYLYHPCYIRLICKQHLCRS